MSLTWHGGVFLGGLALSLAWVAAPAPARACGGTFCDAGPASMPVDQSGENILFIVDGSEVEVHIQIQYEGDPAKFAWVIPLAAVPEFSIGSEALFQSLLAGTVPTYGFTTVRDDCPSPGGRGVSQDAAGFGDEGGASGGDAPAPEDPDIPEVVLRETVGAYEIAVLQGGSAEEVIAWLDTNGYQQDPEAAPIMAEYLAEGLLFGAIKLTGGADVDQIHPIVLRMQTTEACVPLRLTRIAAVEDMEVRTFFLGDARMVPSNYRHVLINPLELDWLQLAPNYKEVIIGAVDAEHADGRAFVTEYAGPSSVVSSEGLRGVSWAPDAFRSLAPAALPVELQSQGLASCTEWDGCQLLHPLVGGMLGEFLALPEGLAIEQYLECPDCYPEIIEWDADGFANAFDERVVAPGVHGEELLAKWPYVTRMYTTISPHEMTKDPIFHARGDLDDVTNIQQGTRRIMCDSSILFTLPDGREVYIPNGSGWPEFPAQMPWEEEVSEIPLAGAPLQLSSRTEEIDQLLASYNASVGWGNVGCNGCTVEDDGSPRRFALGALVMLLGAGLLRRRTRG